MGAIQHCDVHNIWLWNTTLFFKYMIAPTYYQSINHYKLLNFLSIAINCDVDCKDFKESGRLFTAFFHCVNVLLAKVMDNTEMQTTFVLSIL